MADLLDLMTMCLAFIAIVGVIATSAFGVLFCAFFLLVKLANKIG